jgi:hypothetical protein
MEYWNNGFSMKIENSCPNIPLFQYSNHIPGQRRRDDVELKEV